jgi:hypothetical protein
MMQGSVGKKLATSLVPAAYFDESSKRVAASFVALLGLGGLSMIVRQRCEN